MPYGRPQTELAAGLPLTLPKIPGPWGEPPASEEFKPMTPAGIAVHAAGGALNAASSVVALRFLVRHRGAARGAWGQSVAGAAAGTYAADLVTGLLHWSFDTWFDEDVEPLRRMVFLVREHHMRPARIFRYRLRDEAGILSWFAFALSAPLYARAMRPPGAITPARYATVLGALVMATEIVVALEFHKYGHRFRRGRVPRLLQRAGLLLSPELHLTHHSGRHDEQYCLITGVADRTLGRLGLFRGLERVITAVTGAQPRRDDLEWSLRYGRPV